MLLVRATRNHWSPPAPDITGGLLRARAGGTLPPMRHSGRHADRVIAAMSANMGDLVRAAAGPPMTPEERKRREKMQRRQRRLDVLASTVRLWLLLLAAWGFVYVAVALARIAWQA